MRESQKKTNPYKEYKENLKLFINRREIQIPLLSFPVYDLLESVKKQYFPNLITNVSIGFVEQDNLACIDNQTNSSFIFVHTLINGNYTPIGVVGFIIKHELLHLEFPPQTINGKLTHHTDEFWERERLIAPERTWCWIWIWHHFHRCLKRSEEEERTKVLRNWKSILTSKWEIKISESNKGFVDLLRIENQELPKEGEFLKWL